MKKASVSILIVLVFSVGGAQAQSLRSTDPISRPRLVGSSKTNSSARSKFQNQSAQQQPPPRPVETGTRPAEKPAAPNRPQPEQPRPPAREDSSSVRLSPHRIRSRINEAERLMKIRPVQTALMSPSLDYVTISALLPQTSQIHLIRISKQTFLTKGTEVSATTWLLLPVSVGIVRANGVNTAVTVFDDKNRSLLPLAVEFPIEHKGVFRELAYYTSAHPALLSAELMKSGQTYVNSMVDLAAKRLRERGASIAPNIVTVGKCRCRLAHTDH